MAGQPRWRFWVLEVSDAEVTLAGAEETWPAWARVMAVRPETPELILYLDASSGRVELGRLLFQAGEGRSISSTGLHSIRVEPLVADAIAEVVDWYRRRRSADLAEVWPEGVDDPAEILTTLSRPHIRRRDAALASRRGKVVTDAQLRRAAEIYTQALATGSPTLAVGETLHLSARTAARWVAMARERGFLSPYSRSGTPTPEEE